MAASVYTVASVRARPGMFVGNTGDGAGALTVLLEVLANAYDQHLAGGCTRVAVRIDPDGTVTIEDNGPGMAAEGGDGLPGLHELLTVWSARPTVDAHRPHVHFGLGGLGLFVVNALSDLFELRSVRAGVLTTVVYARGEAVDPVTTTPSTAPSGTLIRFRPDPTLFLHPRMPQVELARRLEDLSFLVPNFALSWTIAGDALASGGLPARVAFGASCTVQSVATHTRTYSTACGPIDVEVALAWRRGPGEMNRAAEIDSFVNLERTREHGSHVDGLFDGVRAFGARERGLVAAVSVVLADVKYGTPSRDRLATTETVKPVAAATMAVLDAWERSYPELAASVMDR